MLAYWYNFKEREYYIEPVTHHFGDSHRYMFRIGLAFDKTQKEFRRLCRRKIKQGRMLVDYSHMFIVWREDLNRWTVSYIPF